MVNVTRSWIKKYSRIIAYRSSKIQSMADFNKLKIPKGGLDCTLTEKQKTNIEKSGYLTDFQIFLPTSGTLEATSTCKHIKSSKSSKNDNAAAMWWLTR